jgi:uncharacterized PurR-regulated membrane protein YhhQ (DUF165 family)
MFVATVWAANWAITKWGTTPVGFGLTAPAGVWFAGLAFTLRDVTHRTLGRTAVVWAIAAGCLLAYLVDDKVMAGGHVSIALASAIAFAFSEMSDMAVYEPIRRKGWLPAVVASNAVGIVVDSALFLWLAFGGLAFFWGQVVGKSWMTVAAIMVLAVLRPARLKLA